MNKRLLEFNKSPLYDREIENKENQNCERM